MIIPYKVDVLPQRDPSANGTLILLMAGVYGSTWVLGDAAFAGFLLDGFSLPGLFTHMFLHLEMYHLAGNLIFLYVFGNAVNARIGNGNYLIIFIAVGLASSVAHIFLADGRALGASGAINGVVAMFFAFYPRSQVHCLSIIFKTFKLPTPIIVGMWFVFDIFGLLFANNNVGYAAHVGGFIGGLIVAFTLVRRGKVTGHLGQPTLFG